MNFSPLAGPRRARAPRTLVLASSSPYRRQLLERLRLPFIWSAPNIDETRALDETPAALVRRLSQEKAGALAAAHPLALIIGSDQVAVNGAVVLGKPGTHARARAQLRTASGRAVRFLSGLCVLDAASGAVHSEVVATTVVFRALSEAVIEAYLEAEQPYDCAGSFKAEGLGIALFERISSDDPTALTGLPLIRLSAVLAEFGCPVLP